jgi:hypothetical protein
MEAITGDAEPTVRAVSGLDSSFLFDAKDKRPPLALAAR